MPIDINLLRAEKGGDPDYWRGVVQKRFMDVALVEKVIDLDMVRSATFRLDSPLIMTPLLFPICYPVCPHI